MKAYLSINKISKNPIITIPGSKSESNRLLVLKGIYPNLSINNLSDSDDTLCLQKGIKQKSGMVNVHHAGTAMRFLTAYFASKKGLDISITGSKRMQERPIKVLVDALRNIGAEIHYLKNEGFPPLKIIGKELKANEVNLNANISSQYISALMLIAPTLDNGLTIELEGEITSIPYINMTLDLMKKIGVDGVFRDNKINIKPLEKIKKFSINVESDWSSASYYFSLVALSSNLGATLKCFSEDSLQGDSKVASIFQKLGVKSVFNASEGSIYISKSNEKVLSPVCLNLNDTPDIAQTIAVTCFGLGVSCKLEGLKTLKIKETDRLLALKTELEKLGAIVNITDETLEVIPANKIKENIVIETYQDHRMAMAFAPLVLKTPIVINEPKVVTKSYATFWEDLIKTGVSVEIK